MTQDLWNSFNNREKLKNINKYWIFIKSINKEIKTATFEKMHNEITIKYTVLDEYFDIVNPEEFDLITLMGEYGLSNFLHNDKEPAVENLTFGFTFNYLYGGW